MRHCNQLSCRSSRKAKLCRLEPSHQSANSTHSFLHSFIHPYIPPSIHSLIPTIPVGVARFSPIHASPLPSPAAPHVPTTGTVPSPLPTQGINIEVPGCAEAAGDELNAAAGLRADARAAAAGAAASGAAESEYEIKPDLSSRIPYKAFMQVSQPFRESSGFFATGVSEACASMEKWL